MLIPRPRRLAVPLAATILLGLLLAPATVSGRTPAWTITVTPIPTTVSPGAYAAYRVTIANNGKSNIAKLFLTDSRTEAPFSVSPSTGCASSGALNCALGALGSGNSVTRTIVYQTPTTGTSFDVTFEANTSGVSFSDNGTSHGDALRGPASTRLNGDGNFAGGYVVTAGSSFTTGAGDVQQTSVDAPTTGIGVTIAESPGSTNPCNVGTAIGQLAALNVGDGQRFATPFKVTLKIQARNNLPDELELSQIKLCHQYDGGSAVLLQSCSADAPTGAPCFFPKFDGRIAHPDSERHGEQDADDYAWLIIDVWDFSNGNIRGGF